MLFPDFAPSLTKENRSPSHRAEGFSIVYSLSEFFVTISCNSFFLCSLSACIVLYPEPDIFFRVSDSRAGTPFQIWSKSRIRCLIGISRKYRIRWKLQFWRNACFPFTLLHSHPWACNWFWCDFPPCPWFNRWYFIPLLATDSACRCNSFLVSLFYSFVPVWSIGSNCLPLVCPPHADDAAFSLPSYLLCSQQMRDSPSEEMMPADARNSVG